MTCTCTIQNVFSKLHPYIQTHCFEYSKWVSNPWNKYNRKPKRINLVKIINDTTIMCSWASFFALQKNFCISPNSNILITISNLFNFQTRKLTKHMIDAYLCQELQHPWTAKIIMQDKAQYQGGIEDHFRSTCFKQSEYFCRFA